MHAEWCVFVCSVLLFRAHYVILMTEVLQHTELGQSSESHNEWSWEESRSPHMATVNASVHTSTWYLGVQKVEGER